MANLFDIIESHIKWNLPRTYDIPEYEVELKILNRSVVHGIAVKMGSVLEQEVKALVDKYEEKQRK